MPLVEFRDWAYSLPSCILYFFFSSGMSLMLCLIKILFLTSRGRLFSYREGCCV